MNDSNKKTVSQGGDKSRSLVSGVAFPGEILEEVRMFSSYADLGKYQLDLMARLNLPPWSGIQALRQSENPQVLRTYYSLSGYVCNESAQQLLFFDAHYRVVPIGHRHVFTAEQAYPGCALGFRQWLARFQPKNWNDLMMVHDCYLEYAATGDGPNWTNMGLTENPEIDVVLKISRGVLLWWDQFEEVMTEALKKVQRTVAIEDIEEMAWGYEEYLNGAASERALKIKKLSCGGRSLVKILQERMLYRSALQLGKASEEQHRLAQALWDWRIC